jgi:hypothetical protein
VSVTVSPMLKVPPFGMTLPCPSMLMISWTVAAVVSVVLFEQAVADNKIIPVKSIIAHDLIFT